MENRQTPVLYIIIPCYNEQEVLPITAPQFLKKITDLSAAGKISPDSRVLFVNDGSKDRTWAIINELAASDPHYAGICQSRNRGHQNAVLAGLMEAKDRCDITISIDCDGQDDINAHGRHGGRLPGRLRRGLRRAQQAETPTPSSSGSPPRVFYKLLNAMGAEVVFNHADYRLMSARVLQEFCPLQGSQPVFCGVWCRWWASNPPAWPTNGTSALPARATIPCPRCSPWPLTASPACPSSPSASSPGSACWCADQLHRRAVGRWWKRPWA